LEQNIKLSTYHICIHKLTSDIQGTKPYQYATDPGVTLANFLRMSLQTGSPKLGFASTSHQRLQSHADIIFPNINSHCCGNCYAIAVATSQYAL